MCNVKGLTKKIIQQAQKKTLGAGDKSVLDEKTPEGL